jgi:hypothetical protein
MTLLQIFLSSAFFHHASTFSNFTSFKTLWSHLNLVLRYFREPLGCEKVIFLQGEFSSIDVFYIAMSVYILQKNGFVVWNSCSQQHPYIMKIYNFSLICSLFRYSSYSAGLSWSKPGFSCKLWIQPKLMFCLLVRISLQRSIQMWRTVYETDRQAWNNHNSNV